jgi:hypothetical protein
MTNVLIKCIQDIYEKSDNDLTDDQKDMLKRVSSKNGMQKQK